MSLLKTLDFYDKLLFARKVFFISIIECSLLLEDSSGFYNIEFEGWHTIIALTKGCMAILKGSAFAHVIFDDNTLYMLTVVGILVTL